MEKFRKSLKNVRTVVGLGRVLEAALWLFVISVACLLMLGWVDSTYALENGSRKRALYLLITIFSVVLLGLMIVRMLMKISDAAELVDKKLDNDRSDISDALSLTAQENQSPLHGYLKEKRIAEAEEQLSKVPLGVKLPIRGMAIGGVAILSVAALTVGVRSLHAEKFDTVAKRLLFPNEDIAPYTTLKFTLDETSLEVLYGDDCDVRMIISGEEITEDVVCMVKNRKTGEVEELTSLKESRDIYVQRFNRVINETEFAFRVGNARSKWHQLGLILQPEIVSTELIVAPPAYTRRKAEKYKLDGGEVSLIEGTRVQLRVESNRPLGSGAMVLKALDSDTVLLEETSTRLLTDRIVEFEWVVRNSGQLAFEVFDVRQTASKSKVEFVQKAIPDKAPEVALVSPAPRIMATPKMTVALKGEIEDDFGLNEVSIYRALKGFRDRGEVVERGVSRDRYDYNEPLDLGKLGVIPGQILEFYLEAKDFNPNMLGVGSSDPVVVEIISIEQYAQSLRDRAVMREFSTRYAVLAKQLHDAKRSLEELKKAIESGDSKAIEQARRNAAKAHEKSKEMLSKMAKDFQAFDMEKRLKKIAAEGEKKLSENMEQLNSDKPLSKEDVQKMLDKLGGTQQKADKLKKDADKISKVSKVQQMAAQFKKLYYNQESIRNRMNTLSREMAFGNDKNMAQLKSLGKLQKKNKDALEAFAKELKKRSDALPEEFQEMKDSVEVFLENLEKLEITSPMGSASKSAEDGRAIDATKDAHLALTLMQQLMDESKGFG